MKKFSLVLTRPARAGPCSAKMPIFSPHREAPAETQTLDLGAASQQFWEPLCPTTLHTITLVSNTSHKHLFLTFNPHFGLCLSTWGHLCLNAKLRTNTNHTASWSLTTSSSGNISGLKSNNYLRYLIKFIQTKYIYLLIKSINSILNVNLTEHNIKSSLFYIQRVKFAFILAPVM